LGNEFTVLETAFPADSNHPPDRKNSSIAEADNIRKRRFIAANYLKSFLNAKKPGQKKGG